MFVNGRYGFAQVFLIPGETPMLCGRPIIQQLGISIDFANERLRYGEGHWTSALLETLNNFQAYVTKELHTKRERVIWEVYTGVGRASQIAEVLGARTRVFSYETGWDFDEALHRKSFLDELATEFPDELLLSPSCGLWSVMQNLAARTTEQKEILAHNREWHHHTHLMFVRKAYLQQLSQGGNAHIEQPEPALSWKTRALHDLPGLHANFDQCEYGAQCQADDLQWKPTKKATKILTSKVALWKQFQKRCSGNHEHCKLEGNGPDVGRRTKYMENYQSMMATLLATSLMVDELPAQLDWAGVAQAADEMAFAGQLNHLMAKYSPGSCGATASPQPRTPHHGEPGGAPH